MKGLERLRRAESLPWIVLVVAFAILLALIGASVASFLSVAEVHANVTLAVRSSAAFRGTSSSGLLWDNGSVTFTIYFDVNDSTSRGLTFFTVGYKIWLEDAPAEAHLANLTRSPADLQVTNASGTRSWFPAFEGSKQTSPFPVPARGNATMAFPLEPISASDPGHFQAIQNITEYAVNVLGGTSHLVWNVWVLVNLDIDGIPPPASLSEAPYFASISRIQFTEGVDLGGLPVGGP